MHTVRMTLNVNEALLAEVQQSHPGVTKTALIEEGSFVIRKGTAS